MRLADDPGGTQEPGSSPTNPALQALRGRANDSSPGLSGILCKWCDLSVRVCVGAAGKDYIHE